MFARAGSPGKDLRRLVDILARYKSGKMSLQRACRKAEAVNCSFGESGGLPAVSPAGLDTDDYRHMLFDVIARCKRGEIDSRTASREAYLIRSVLHILCPPCESDAVPVVSGTAEEEFQET